MEPIEWLEKNVPGFSELPEEDRRAILHFALLWSLFEARALQTRASAHSIISVVHQWAAQGRLKAEAFETSLQYFRERYFQNGQATHYFAGLNLRRNDRPALVRAVLDGTNNNSADAVAALLVVVYRLRNNLFHGVKWTYGIQGQRSNFEHANEALMSALSYVVADGA
ncbi:MAG: hypothetical protein AMXMBFR16_12350 [Candidatus Uhrbacteria bacterium]